MVLVSARRPHLLLSLLLLTSCREEILHDLREEDANRVLVLLADQEMEGEKRKEQGGWSVNVDRSIAEQALRTIQQSRIIRRVQEEVEPRSLLPFREEREHYRERQLSLALEETLQRIPGVIEARVHLILESVTDRAPGSERRVKSGSVLLIRSKEWEITDQSIKLLVAGASGVTPEQLSVVVSEAPSSVPTPMQPPLKSRWFELLLFGGVFLLVLGAIVVRRDGGVKALTPERLRHRARIV